MKRMTRMPCKCSGFRVDKCKCKVLRTGYHPEQASNVVLLTQSNSICRLLDLKNKRDPNLFMRVVENVYETCAGYNLRYCPIRGFVRHDHYIKSTVKDLLILICFLLANFIVFVTIMTKTMVHMYFVLIMTAQWVKRYFGSKLDANEEMISLSPAQLYHDYTPPITDRFL